MTQPTSSRHLVDPELLPLLDVFPDFDFTPANLSAIREQFVEMMAAIPAPPENGVTLAERYAPGPAGSS